jgi:hypothetical protein
LSLLVFLSIAVAALGQKPPGVSKLAGSWTWTWNDREGKVHTHTLEVEGVGKALAAREVFDDQPPVKVTNLTFDGTTVKFTVVRGQRRADYNGKMADQDTIQGTVTTTATGETDEYTWKAVRKKEPAKPNGS